MDKPVAIACTEVWGGNRAVAAPLDLPGLRGWVLSRPHEGAAEGGDVHYVSSCGTGRITRFLLVDVSGHGETAGELGRRLRELMQRYLNHVRPHSLAKRLNRDMAKIVGRSGRFATGLIVTFFSPHGRMSICNAGHPPPLLYRAAEQTWELIRYPSPKTGISNLPLGVVEESGYVGHKLTLHPGDRLLGYTDCLIEATAEDGEMLQIEGLKQLVEGIDPDRLTDPHSAVDALLDTIREAGYGLDDDLTVFLLQCTERSHGRGFKAFLAGIWRAIKLARRPHLAPLPDLLLRWRV